ncbi:hypothetical protein [Bacillus cereus group sp. BfR-BA-01380]|uniref:hypothetical protein n=1 Tax=Bacillus cereus group sp. BfR-BA-01380 TaxID=2920324 RepID=UPI001F58656F|nr:hypothetical protein [Bacillus cereus group sp. BfR-BA-01380]
MGFVKEDRYKQIRTIYLSDKEYKPISIVLDANIIKRIQDFFYFPHKMEVSKRLSIIDFLLKYRRFDLVAGAGLEELYNRDVKSVQRFEEIMNFFINCSKKEIMYHSESTVNPMLKPLPSN